MRTTTVCAALIIALAPAIKAKTFGKAEIVINWDAVPKNRTVSCPATASERRMAIRVTNVNDIVYAHAIETSVTATPVYVPLEPFSRMEAASAPPLEQAVKAINALMGIYSPGFVPEVQNGKRVNLGLSKTLAAWKTFTDHPEWKKWADTLKGVKAFEAKTPDQRTLKDRILAFATMFEKARAAIEGPGSKPNAIETGVEVDWAAKNAISIKVTQTYNGEAVDNGEQTFSCTVDSGAFTLSLGPVFSKIQARQYTSTAVPGGAGTTNVLGVQYGRGLRPTGATLVNFAVPHLSWGGWALYLTTGPTVKSSADSTASFGWFAGASVGLNKVLYLTPGFHYGEFADFPMGYATGTPIPSGAGTPNPVKRSTWRFAFGISFRVASFAKTEQKQVTPAVTPAATPPTTPAVKTTPDVPSSGPAPTPPAGGAGGPSGLPASPGSEPPKTQ